MVQCWISCYGQQSIAAVQTNTYIIYSYFDAARFTWSLYNIIINIITQYISLVYFYLFNLLVFAGPLTEDTSLQRLLASCSALKFLQIENEAEQMSWSLSVIQSSLVSFSVVSFLHQWGQDFYPHLPAWSSPTSPMDLQQFPRFQWPDGLRLLRTSALSSSAVASMTTRPAPLVTMASRCWLLLIPRRRPRSFQQSLPTAVLQCSLDINMGFSCLCIYLPTIYDTWAIYHKLLAHKYKGRSTTKRTMRVDSHLIFQQFPTTRPVATDFLHPPDKPRTRSERVHGIGCGS